MNPDQLIAMLGVYERWAKSICAPVFWQDIEGRTRNGSMTFLKTEMGVLGITNAHVADGLMGCSDQLGSRCQGGGAYLDPSRLRSGLFVGFSYLSPF